MDITRRNFVGALTAALAIPSIGFALPKNENDFITIKMVNEAYNGGYMSYFSSPFMVRNYFNQIDPIGYTHISMPHSARGIMENYMPQHHSAEYREKLKNLLQKLISVAKMVLHE